MSQIKPFPFARIPAYFRLARSQGNGCWTSFLSLLVEKEVCFHASALQRLAEETKSAFFFSIWSQAFRNAGRIAAKSCFTLKCRRRSHSVTDLVPPPNNTQHTFQGSVIFKQASKQGEQTGICRERSRRTFFPPSPHFLWRVWRQNFSADVPSFISSLRTESEGWSTSWKRRWRS